MEKTEIELLLDYMYWVNDQLTAAAERMAREAYLESRGATRSLHETLVHELDVEWSWRLNLQGRPMEEMGDDLRPADFPDVKSLRERWKSDEQEMRSWIAELTNEDMVREVDSQFTRDSRPLWQYLVHIVMHAAQQQADAAAMLTAAGESPGEIGFLEYLRQPEDDKRRRRFRAW